MSFPPPPSAELACNLLLNATCSFVAGCLLVLFVQWVFRVGATRWSLFLLCLPFTKILWDLFQGVPQDSYLFTTLDPWNLPPRHRALYLGAGFSYLGPVLSLGFSIQDLWGSEYSISLADFLVSWLSRHLSPSVPRLLLTLLAGVSLFLLARRALAAFRFHLRRRRDQGNYLWAWAFSGRRRVPIFRSSVFRGTPFTGGVLRPYICFPEETFAVLSPAEREAVIRHELAHVRHFDLPVTLSIQCLGDIFWFVPGYRFLARKIDRLRELVADRAAVEDGASPAELGSALLSMRDRCACGPLTVLYSAFVREKSLLRERVLHLAGKELPPRWGWTYLPVRFLVVLWTVGGVMIATLGGNHGSALSGVDPWIRSLLQGWGLW